MKFYITTNDLICSFFGNVQVAKLHLVNLDLAINPIILEVHLVAVAVAVVNVQ